MTCVLVATLHDPDGRLYAQIARVLPVLTNLFDGIAIQATHASQERLIALLTGAGALVRRELPEHFVGYMLLGRPRRDALEFALERELTSMLFCDFDRALHWAEFYPDELARIIPYIQEYDFIVLGRTERAFASHPRIQRDTEAIVNHVYAQVSGLAWDITAAARGLSRRAAAALLAGCHEESIGTDGVWPLFLQQAGGFSLGYIATEGLEFETPDRFGDEVAAAGGLEPWLARLDADPRLWAQRLAMAHAEVEALLPYSPPDLGVKS